MASVIAAAAAACSHGPATEAAPRPTTRSSHSAAPSEQPVPIAPFAESVGGRTRLVLDEHEKLAASLGGDDSSVVLPSGGFTLYGLCQGPTPVTLTFVDETDPFWIVPCDGLPSRLRGSGAVERRAAVSGQADAEWEVLVAVPDIAPSSSED
ncbi:hypothetical protein [Cellulomonas edaphi]|uniref:Lipoprotein n=1 Tax=Cellulomonas edaphi TaxID=3053468 RepID=A0ABT7S5E7_9CELL|nr:hypothetical protein [Cellulomons edaphi]MDM7830832.1 hypothetical protein [Cellulomons edaphi]